MTQTPASWYPDPDPAAARRSSLRYWDGTAWTAHVHTATAAVAPTGPTTPDGEPLAGWWWRVLAYVIDSIILSIATSVFSIPAQIEMQREMQRSMEEFAREVEANPEQTPDFGFFFDDMVGVMQDNAFWLTVPSVVVFALYFGGFLRWKGATPGKLMLGMRVRLRDRPGTLPWSSILSRMLVQFGVSWTFFVLAYVTGSGSLVVLAVFVSVAMLIDPLWATWDDKRQTLHDKLAATNVVRKQ